MSEFDCIAVTLYAHDLKEPSKSFAERYHISDFKQGLFWTIKKARKVTYTNPRGTSMILKEKKHERV